MSERKARKILIIDGHSLAHRAFHALPPTLSRADGTPTNAVLGFCNMMVKLLEQEQPDVGICAFDRPSPTFRHEQYEEYKATRKPMDESLRVQMPIVREAARAFGFSVVELDGWEADDVIGTLSRMAEEAEDEAIIVTGDRDALQLASDRVRVVLTRRGISEFDEYGPDEVRAKYGFGPELIPDFKGLMGDVSDNIPGVPGVGEKTAMRLVSEIGAVEDVLAGAHSIKQERLKNALLENAEQARASKYLATIDRNAPIGMDLEQCCAVQRDPGHLAEFLRKQGFRLLLSRLGLVGAGVGPGSGPGTREGAGQASLFGAAPSGGAAQEGGEGGGVAAVGGESGAPGSADVQVVTTREGVEELAARLRKAGRFAFDIVSAGARTVTARVVGLAFVAPGVSGYVPVGGSEHGADGDSGEGSNAGCLSPETAASRLGPVFADSAIEKSCHDVKEKIILLRSIGCELSGVSFDSMIAAYLVDPAAPNGEMCDLAEKWIGASVPRVRESIRQEVKRTRNPEGCIGSGAAASMCARCLAVMPQLEATLLASISSYGMDRLYREIEMPLAAVLADMEMTGVKVDAARLRELSREMDSTLNQLVAEIYRHAGEEFNINSTKQLGHVLFERLGLPPVKKTKTGYSTDAEVLEALAELHPVVGKVLEYREIAKLKSTYVDALPELINPWTGRIHTTFNQTVTATGRLSSTDPNLQNIPVRTGEGRKIRDAFIAGQDGWVIISADYSQIELRVLAHISQDATLIQSFLRDEDIHRRTAAEVFGVDFDDVTPEMRSRAKAVNFGIVYGISDYGLAKNIGVKPAEAKEFIERYFERYSGVRSYMNSIRAQAKLDGYVTTLMNRRRLLPELSSPSFAVRRFAERVAMNTPIQGSAADIIKRAMVNAHARLAKEGLRARLLLQVHDELVLEAPADEAEAAAALVAEEMSESVQFTVPLKVDVAVGKSWMDAK
ncbi:MAG: DNA polymerase I [Firmicutes bacterium]|nr:DNA polymerase I [Bacillota bacterium]